MFLINETVWSYGSLTPDLSVIVISFGFNRMVNDIFALQEINLSKLCISSVGLFQLCVLITLLSDHFVHEYLFSGKKSFESIKGIGKVTGTSERSHREEKNR